MTDKNKHHHHETGCHYEHCSSGLRNRYYKNKNMIADDFKLEQRYGIERRRLLNRAISGWGVAYGFNLTISDNHLLCTEGLALDSCGRELLRTESGKISKHQILLNKEDFQPGQDYKCILKAHYAERFTDQVRTGHSCGCGETEWNHICETIVFSLARLKETSECPPAEPSCPECECCPDTSDQSRMRHESYSSSDCDNNRDRRSHHCLCQWLSGNIPPEPTCLQNWEGFEHYRIALDNPVPLACVTVTIDDCGHPLFQSIDDQCQPRRLIKTNDLLFDLIRGCDLTRIDEISWADWHRKFNRHEMMPWEKFEELIFPDNFRMIEKLAEKREPVETGFWIDFSRPVDVSTLKVDCINMTVLAPEDEGGWIEVRRVPIVKIAPSEDVDFTKRVFIFVDSGWCSDEILGHKSIFHRRKIQVEIEVRGDLIVDCNGQAVDANAVGLQAMPTGNGTPGGTFISSFRVSPKRETKPSIEAED